MAESNIFNFFDLPIKTKTKYEKLTVTKSIIIIKFKHF